MVKDTNRDGVISWDEAIKQGISWVVAVIVILVLIFSTFYTIGAGSRGVLLTFGKADPFSMGEGLHVKVPLIQSIVKMSVQTQKYEADASAASSDLQIVTAKIATNYHLVENTVATLYTNVGLGYSDSVIQPMEQEIVKSVTAQYTAEELITKREEVRQDIKRLMTERLLPRGIVVEEVSITNFDFSPSFNAAIENKVTMEQNALAAKNKLEQIKFEAQQKVEEAKGQAQSIQIINDQLRNSPDYIEYIKIQKWDGKLPAVTGGAVPFIDISQQVKP